MVASSVRRIGPVRRLSSGLWSRGRLVAGVSPSGSSWGFFSSFVFFPGAPARVVVLRFRPSVVRPVVWPWGYPAVRALWCRGRRPSRPVPPPPSGGGGAAARPAGWPAPSRVPPVTGWSPRLASVGPFGLQPIVRGLPVLTPDERAARRHRVPFTTPSWGARFSGILWLGVSLRPVGPARWRPTSLAVVCRSRWSDASWRVPIAARAALLHFCRQGKLTLSPYTTNRPARVLGQEVAS